jgi:hypothetical protein
VVGWLGDKKGCLIAVDLPVMPAWKRSVGADLNDVSQNLKRFDPNCAVPTTGEAGSPVTPCDSSLDGSV